MGPITLFDKSFIQSLSVDESTWFDQFFLTNVCPLFFSETLADLEKSVREGRTPEQEVGVIADKFPGMHGMPCAPHRTLCIGELSGYPVPMTGVIPLSGGRRVESPGGRAAVFEPSPEADAFGRWQRSDFLEVERRYARHWRQELTVLDVDYATRFVRSLGINPADCHSFDQAKAMAVKSVSGTTRPFESVAFAIDYLGVPKPVRRRMLLRWLLSGKPPLSKHAPYANHVLEVEVFLQIVLASKLISSERPSNRIDIEYLFYLPFCMMFVSNDRLHQRTAPLFLRPDQEFVWGLDLKTNLGEIDGHYDQIREQINEKGVISLTDDPPLIGNQLVYDLWGRLLPKWKPGEMEVGDREGSPTVEEIMKLKDAAPTQEITTSGELDQVLIERSLKSRKGSWYQIRLPSE